MKEDTIQFSSQKDVKSMITVLRDFASGSQKTSIDRIENEPDPFGEASEPYDIQVVTLI